MSVNFFKVNDKSLTQIAGDLTRTAYNNLLLLIGKKIDNPTSKSNGQVLMYDSASDKWVGSDAVSTLSNAKVDNSVISDAYSESKNYVKGDYFIDNNVLYKVKANCVNKIPPNSNYYDVVKVADEIEELSQSDSWESNGVSLLKKGNLVCLRIVGAYTVNQNALTTLCTIPSKYRPSNTQYITGTIERGSGGIFEALIESNGIVEVNGYVSSGSSLPLRATVTYIV